VCKKNYISGVTSTLFNHLFHYDDYRRFLEDFFQEQKQKRATFSHRFFARKAGFTSSSFCLSVIKGRFNLSQVALGKVVGALGLDTRQASYFGALVQYNQAKHQADRDQAWLEIQQIRKAVAFKKLESPQHGYFSRWYYPVIRELAVHPSWNGDELQLARMLEPQITTEEAREALQNLLDWEILLKAPSGKYLANSQMINAEGVPPVALRTIRREFLQLGVGALDTMPPSQRFLTFSTLAMSEDSYEYALQVIEDARKKILTRASADDNVQKVYELVLQLFPLTRPLPGGTP